MNNDELVYIISGATIFFSFAGIVGTLIKKIKQIEKTTLKYDEKHLAVLTDLITEKTSYYSMKYFADIINKKITPPQLTKIIVKDIMLSISPEYSELISKYYNEKTLELTLSQKVLMILQNNIMNYRDTNYSALNMITDLEENNNG